MLQVGKAGFREATGKWQREDFPESPGRGQEGAAGLPRQRWWEQIWRAVLQHV